MKDFLQKIPKVELHLHLEGAIPLDALWELIKKYKNENNRGSYDEFRKKFIYKGFSDFLDTWIWMIQYIREYEDFTFLTEAVVDNLKKQNYIYAELFYSPARHIKNKLEPAAVTEAIQKGLDKYKNDLTVNIIADVSRDFGSRQASFIVENIIESKAENLKGIGLGGTESLYHADSFENVFKKAREAGLRTTAHAGENAGPESIWTVIRKLKVERIGHAATAIQDSELIQYLKEKRIPLELCPLSNVKTGVIKNLNEHPIKQYVDHGLHVHINTDDPTFFNTSLVDEFLSLNQTFGFEQNQVSTFILNAIKAAWCTDQEKALLVEKLQKFINIQ